MSSADQTRTPSGGRALGGLRANCFSAVVMLLVEFGLGMGVNLYARLPASDHGNALLTAVVSAVTRGPVVLTLHALLGAMLLITGASAVVRGSRSRLPMLIVTTAVGWLSIVVASMAGARFVGDMTKTSSLEMAVAAGVAILSYTLTLLLVPGSLPGPATR